MLESLLIHQGHGATAGHYVAQAYDYAKGHFVQCDDTEAGQLKKVPYLEKHKRPFFLGEVSTDANACRKFAKLPAEDDGVHKSSNMYMLVYRRKSAVGQAEALGEAGFLCGVYGLQ